MSLKLPLYAGYFDPDTAQLLPVGVDRAAVCEALIRAGGRLLGHCGPEDTQRLAIAAAMKGRGNCEVLGFVGSEYVILHEAGFLKTTLGYGTSAELFAFLRVLISELGCQVYSANEGKVVTAEILERLGSLSLHATIEGNAAEA